MELVFEYSKWLLTRHPKQAMRVFTSDASPPYSQGDVLAYLQKLDLRLSLTYLEYLHTLPACDLYVDVPNLHLECLVRVCLDAKDPMDVSTYLRANTDYDNDFALKVLPLTWHKERAYVYGRQHDYRRALRVLCYDLGDLKEADVFCEDFSSQQNSVDAEFQEDAPAKVPMVYLTLLVDMYQAKACDLPKRITTEAVGDSLLRLLDTYITSLDAVQVLTILPQSLPLQSLLPYLRAIGEHALRRHPSFVCMPTRSESTSFSRLKGLMSSALTYQAAQLRAHTTKRVQIGVHRSCIACGMRLGHG